jgi:polysaccharide chain length determinant protein (PEP-CTERM system associated)
MKELVDQGLSLLRGALRFRWPAMIAAWAACIVGWSAVWLVPDQYESRAKVYVDTESVLRPLLAGLAVNADPMNQLRMMQSVLVSRPNLERIAKETDLALRAKDAAALEELVAGLPDRIGLVGGGRDQIFSISFRDHDRAMAQRVVEAMLDSFVEDSMDLKKEDSSSAQRFLEQQIREYEARLREAEAKLADFKRGNVGLMPGEGGDYYARLQMELTKRDDIAAKLRQATQRRDELARQLEGEEPTFGFGPRGSGGATSAVDAKIVELQRRLEQLLVTYTEKHPDVDAIREQIAQLEERKKSAKSPRDLALPPEDGDGLTASQSLAVNPVYQNMKIAMSQTEVEIADLKAQLGEQQRVVGGLQGRVNTMPRVEADLAQLTRDYEVNKAQYTQLLQRLESARLSQQASTTNDQVKFRILEPPMTPRAPVAPNRNLLLVIVLAVGLSAGIGLAIALNFLKPVVTSRHDLRHLTGLNVIGSISRVVTPESTRATRRDVAWLGGAAAGLVVAFMGLSALVVFMNQRLAAL